MLAIHHRKDSFSELWIEYCQLNNVNYKIVNCFSSSIIADLSDCNALMWHWNQNDVKAQLFARQLIKALEHLEILVYPSHNTCWHFDDKIGQKYLLEAVGAPVISTFVSYELKEALDWIDSATFPKVAKLRGGAGSENVKLLSNKDEAKAYAKRAFSSGFGVSRFRPLQERIWHFKRDKSLERFIMISRGLARVLLPNKVKANLPIDRNYFYAQNFIPNNDHDIRVIVIGERAFAIKRMTRKGDFRASGSGNIIYDPKQIPKECLQISFDLSQKLALQSAAYDFVFSQGKPLVVEVSYAFARKGYLKCPGYWTEELKFIEGFFHPEYFMVEDLLRQLG